MSCKDMFEFYFMHGLLHQELERCMSRSAAFLGLSVADLEVLWMTTLSDTTTLADIARLTTYTKEQIEEIVAGLERDHLVEQVCLGESLYTFIQATDRGMKTLHQLADRPNKCKCPMSIDEPCVQRLMEDSRELVVRFRGKSSYELIADMARRVK